MAQEVLNMSVKNTDGWNYKQEPLDFNGFLPTYKKLKSYDHLISDAENKDYFKGTGFNETVKIIPSIIKNYSFQVRELAKHLKANTEAQSIFNVWHWLVTNIMYDYDKNGNEELRRPARSWADRHTGVDCDCFAIMASSILIEMGIEPILEIVAFNHSNDYGHIYVITKSDLILDPVMKEFNRRPDNITKTLHMSINNYELAGIPKGTNGLAGCIKGLGTIAPPTERTLQLMQMQSKLLQMPVTDVRNRELRKLNYAIKLNDTIEQEIFLAIVDTVYDIGEKGDLIFVNEENALIANLALKKFEEQLKEDENLEGLGKRKRGVKNITKGVKNVVNGVTKTVGKIVGPKISSFAQNLYDKAAAIVKTFNPVSLAARNAYLLLLRVNYRGYAKRFANNPEIYKAFKDNWVKKWGGSSGTLDDAVNAGKKKKQLGGLGGIEINENIEGIGAIGSGAVAGSIAAAITAATPIILAVAPLFKELIKKEDLQKDAEKATDETIVDDTSINDGYSTDDDRRRAKEGGSYLPWIIGGVAVLGILAFFAFKPKGRRK